MNTIITKLKTSATLWSVVGGFVLGFANLTWGNDTDAASIASAILFAGPAMAYIVSKFSLRIKMADANKDGEISLEELAEALSHAANETSEDAQKVIDAVGDVIKVLTNQVNEKERTLTDHGNVIHDEEGD